MRFSTAANKLLTSPLLKTTGSFFSCLGKGMCSMSQFWFRLFGAQQMGGLSKVTSQFCHLTSTGLRLGLNFGAPSLQWKRIIL
ncbi:MAG: hypothetical protein ACRD1R_20845 [Acidobacteriota bacterium]